MKRSKHHTSIELCLGDAAALRRIAAAHGYLQTRGAGAGQLGSVSQLLQAIAAGEVATVLLPDEHFAPAIEHLRAVGEEWANAIANALERALSLQREAEKGE